MALTYAQLRNRIKMLTGNRVDDVRAGDAVNIVLAERWTAWGWHFRQKEAVLITTAPYSTGTVSAHADPNKVQGIGTGWTSAMVGRVIRIAQDVQFYKTIALDVLNQVFTLESNYAGTITPNASYVLSQAIYSLASDVHHITSPAYYRRMRQRTRQNQDRIDARRTFMSNFPWSFIYSGNDTTGALQIEVSPVPSVALPIRYSYLSKAPFLVQGADDATSVPFPEASLVPLAVAAALYTLVAEKPEMPGAQVLLTLADKHQVAGERRLLEDQYADLETAGASEGVREDDEAFMYADDIAWSHDIGIY